MKIYKYSGGDVKEEQFLEMKDRIDFLVKEYEKDPVDLWGLEIHIFKDVIDTFYGPDFMDHLVDINKNV